MYNTCNQENHKKNWPHCQVRTSFQTCNGWILKNLIKIIELTCDINYPEKKETYNINF